MTNSCVVDKNQIVQKLGIQTPDVVLVNEYLKAIAKAYNVEWEPSSADLQQVRAPHIRFSFDYTIKASKCLTVTQFLRLRIHFWAARMSQRRSTTPQLTLQRTCPFLNPTTASLRPNHPRSPNPCPQNLRLPHTHPICNSQKSQCCLQQGVERIRVEARLCQTLMNWQNGLSCSRSEKLNSS